jgi:hypothetical protein
MYDDFSDCVLLLKGIAVAGAIGISYNNRERC